MTSPEIILYSKHEEGVFVDKPMPPLKLQNDPVFYPERKITPKRVNIKGKQYLDVSEGYGL